MTKPVTGVALMQLYERGKFELDAPLAVYAAGVRRGRASTPGLDAQRPAEVRSAEAARSPCATSCVTPRAFTATDRPEAVTAIYRSRSTARDFNNALPEVSARLAKVPLSYQPGTQWRYSDVVDVQAYLVQKISGVPFDEYLKLHILRPLGMTTHALHILPTELIAFSSRR